jgi:hypothetical protein
LRKLKQHVRARLADISEGCEAKRGKWTKMQNNSGQNCNLKPQGFMFFKPEGLEYLRRVCETRPLETSPPETPEKYQISILTSRYLNQTCSERELQGEYNCIKEILWD